MLRHACTANHRYQIKGVEIAEQDLQVMYCLSIVCRQFLAVKLLTAT
jgi:hypothetical protein